MGEKTIIGSIFVFFISFVLKRAFEQSLCDQGFFGCLMAFIMYPLPVIIVVAYWVVKLYPHVEPYLTK